MISGIYCYKDTLNNNEIVYIGKDNFIKYNKRHKDHTSPQRYKDQPINRILQNNPERYKYEILKSWVKNEYSKFLASILEILYIKRHNPKFNFTTGGEDLKGFKLSEKTKKKISNSKKGTKHSLETRKKMSKSQRATWANGRTFKQTEEAKRKISLHNKTGSGKDNHFYGKKHSLESKRKMTEAKKRAKNTSGYYRVCKKNDSHCNQGFVYCYQYYDEKGKPKKITSVDIDKLQQKVLLKGLPWMKYEYNDNSC